LGAKGSRQKYRRGGEMMPEIVCWVAAENATKLKLLIYIEVHLFSNTFTVLGKPLIEESGGLPLCYLSVVVPPADRLVIFLRIRGQAVRQDGWVV
jgi:hypothetical protein